MAVGEPVRDVCQTILIKCCIFHSQRGGLDKMLSQRKAFNRHRLSSGLGYTISRTKCYTCACASAKKKLQITYTTQIVAQILTTPTYSIH